MSMPPCGSPGNDRHSDKGGQPLCINVTQNGDEHARPFPPVEVLEYNSHTNTHSMYCRWNTAGSSTVIPVLTQIVLGHGRRVEMPTCPATCRDWT